MKRKGKRKGKDKMNRGVGVPAAFPTASFLLFVRLVSTPLRGGFFLTLNIK